MSCSSGGQGEGGAVTYGECDRSSGRGDLATTLLTLAIGLNLTGRLVIHPPCDPFELSAAYWAHLPIGPAHRCQPTSRLTSLILHLRYIDGADTDVVTGPVVAGSRSPGYMGACPTIF